ncbi:MAG: AMP-binding protein [Candidatus Omnitrophica bacterium]|nr:AMP-binding protein [Candidatus Omnitrophota bacterium]
MKPKDNLTIPSLFSQAAVRLPQKVCLKVKEGGVSQEYTYKEVESAAVKIAAFLHNQSLQKGQRAAIILQNRPEWAMIYLGIVYAGLIAVPLDPQLGSQELENIILDSSAKVVFSSSDILSNKLNQQVTENLSKIIVIGASPTEQGKLVSFSSLIDSPAGELSSGSWPEEEDVASLVYTSGTTAKPKAVELTHRNIASNFRSLEELGLCIPSDNILSLLPLYHTYSFMGTLIVPLALGATITYCGSKFKPQELSEVIRESGVTVLIGVPQLFGVIYATLQDKLKNIPGFLRFLFIPLIRNKIRKAFGRNLRLIVSGGAKFPADLGRNLSRLMGIKIIDGYGLTETSPVVTINPLTRVKFGSVGKPIPRVKVKVINPDKTGVGQVLIKGPNVMRGYFKDKQLTAQVIKDDWFYSGDLGFFDKEGYLFLTGRENEVIVLGSGKNVYPEELESYYGKAPSIKEICITCLKDKSFGNTKDVLHAVIVPDLEFFQGKNETDIRLKIRWDLDGLKKELPAYKHIMGYTFTNKELPRTVLKKLKRYQIKQYLQAAPKRQLFEQAEIPREDFLPRASAQTKKIIEYLSSQINRPVSLESHLEIDLGIDSLTRVELGLGLESLLKLPIPDELIYRVATVRELVEAVESQARRRIDSRAPRQRLEDLLREQPPASVLDKIRIRPTLFDLIVNRAARALFGVLLRVFFILRIEGRGRLPKEGPYLICPNHSSFLDGLVVANSLPFKTVLETYFFGFRHIFEHPTLKWANKLARLVPMDNNLYLNTALQTASFLLMQKKNVCIFPEGQRSIDGEINQFKKGVGILIKELNVPVVPVYIKGSHQALPRGARFPRIHPIKIIFGNPVTKGELVKNTKSSDRDESGAIADAIREKVVNLRKADKETSYKSKKRMS